MSYSRPPMSTRGRLHGGLSTIEYFTFGFGTMIGVGWLVLMDDWPTRGGPGGGMLGFLIGGLLLFPIAHTYGRLVQQIQDAGAEIAYTEQVMPPLLSFAAGWTMVLSYAIVCPWEAVATGNLLARVFPGLNSYELYSIAGTAIYAPRLGVGLALTLLVAVEVLGGAFIVSLVLFTLGSMFAIVEGIDKLWHPEHLDSPFVAYIVLGIALVAEGLSLRTARREADTIRRGRTWWKFVRTTKNPELPVVLLEDTGALVGLVFALIGITLAEVTGNARWDAVGSIGIGLLLGVIAVVLAIEMKSLLIGEAASPEDEAKILEALETAPCVEKVIHLRTQHLGPDDLLVAAKVDADAPSVAALARAIDELEARIRAAVPTARLIFIEPDQYRPPGTPAAEEPVADMEDADAADHVPLHGSIGEFDQGPVADARADVWVEQGAPPHLRRAGHV